MAWFFKRKKLRVLLLEDDVSMQKLVSALLRRKGHRVDVVDSGTKAIEAIDREDYGVLLLDVMMPTEGGVTVLRYLRQHKPELLQRVILLTATAETVLKSISKDVFAVVRKPFDPDHLIATVNRLA
ncbi:MAG TPA: response regulator [Thermoanaerobaculia bacterium]|jgi:CheY-like chemotaxis protein|nr:response regulator [Thermoanaerobaculia bacterium]